MRTNIFRPARRHHDERGLIAKLCALALAAGLLGGCVGTVVGAAATGGTVISQERSVGDAIDDATIEFVINKNLFQTDPDLFLDVGIDVVEGRVLLTGDVEKPEARVAAIEAAWKADGVREVINEVQVTDESGLLDAAKDAWISAQLSTGLLFDAHVASINYNVETVNGIVYIIGIALTQAELDRVIDRARTIAGVKKVVIHVQLKDDPNRESGP